MDNKKEMAQHSCAESQNFWLWLGALVIGTLLGMLGVGWIDSVTNFVATITHAFFSLWLYLP